MKQKNVRLKRGYVVFLLIMLFTIGCKVQPGDFIPPIEGVVVVKFKNPEYKEYVLVNSLAESEGDSISMCGKQFILPASVVDLYGKSPYMELIDGYLLVDWKWYLLVSTKEQAIIKSKWSELTDRQACWPLTDIYEEFPIEAIYSVPIGSMEQYYGGRIDWAQYDTSGDILTEEEWMRYSKEEKEELNETVRFNDKAYAQYVNILNDMIRNEGLDRYNK